MDKYQFHYFVQYLVGNAREKALLLWDRTKDRKLLLLMRTLEELDEYFNNYDMRKCMDWIENVRSGISNLAGRDIKVNKAVIELAVRSFVLFALGGELDKLSKCKYTTTFMLSTIESVENGIEL